MDSVTSPTALDYARPQPAGSGQWISWAVYLLPALWIGACVLGWATSVHPEEDVPITAVFGAVPACALAFVQLIVRAWGVRSIVPVAVGLNLFIALLWTLMFTWLIALHIEDQQMPRESLPILALLLVSVAVTGLNWWTLRKSGGGVT